VRQNTRSNRTFEIHRRYIGKHRAFGRNPAVLNPMVESVVLSSRLLLTDSRALREPDSKKGSEFDPNAKLTPGLWHEL
jgi:hypothetical protein